MQKNKAIIALYVTDLKMQSRKLNIICLCDTIKKRSEHMRVFQKKLSEIKPYEKNAKKHDRKQIDNVATSIQKFGFVQPIVVDENSEIVIGHCRYEASKKIGLEEVPVVCVDNLAKADVSVNIYAFLKAQNTGEPVELCCAIGDETIDGLPYATVVEIAREYIKNIGGFEKFAEWGLY